MQFLPYRSFRPEGRSVSGRGVSRVVAGVLVLALAWPVAAFAQAEGGAQAKGGGESALRQRVEQLEGQLVDLQVVIGTLESLARTGGVAAAPVRSEASGGMVGDSARLDSMETQIRALTAQVEQLANELRQSQMQRRSDAVAPSGFGHDGIETRSFGSTTVTSAENADPIGALAADPSFGQAPTSGFGQAPVAQQAPTTYGSEALPSLGGDQVAAADPMGGGAAGGGNAKQLYETAYGHLLQQDYGSAQAGFSNFLRSHPQDPLAPSALYWLGEAHYVQRNYSDAAEAFDLVISSYGKSGKAADAQLKHGMSLAQLGKQKDACASLGGVARKYPNAPPQLKARADSERQRIGCP
ncbi:tol-pal system protein YbgF [Hyphomicrobium nitrativorans NL23]|uniref:Cell division coordinator CpoB n=1 Tax=Hyphomicrobium nitrativorans NL23 TaxID=1029756 RepID=V5SEE0_9HYPH|nr:tol-pal system protein YbgF [Hyphomicrobium nitrativorans]AHB48420.1 tol-pal system protein YbgF [Hyphomicrobium nitrativorans NL23]